MSIERATVVSAVSNDPLALLVEGVRANCELADARHASDLSLCTYLLQMREMYRWEAGLALDREPPRAQVGHWIGEREDRWERLLDAPVAGYRRLAPGPGLDPFDEDAVNAWLAREAARRAPLVYAAGIGRFGRAEFVLAECERIESRAGLSVVITGRELARGMNPPLAMLRGDRILVRADVLRRWLATRIAMPHRFGDGVSVEKLLPDAIELMIRHEIGEHGAGDRLGPDWECMLETITDRRTELLLRAVRDLLADCLATLPWLRRSRRIAPLELWGASFDGMRRALSPAMASALVAAREGDARALGTAARDGAPLWHDTAAALLDAWRADGTRGVDEAVATIDALAPLRIAPPGRGTRAHA